MAESNSGPDPEPRIPQRIQLIEDEVRRLPELSAHTPEGPRTSPSRNRSRARHFGEGHHGLCSPSREENTAAVYRHWSPHPARRDRTFSWQNHKSRPPIAPRGTCRTSGWRTSATSAGLLTFAGTRETQPSRTNVLCRAALPRQADIERSRPNIEHSLPPIRYPNCLGISYICIGHTTAH
jgi:hypothetical protein